MHIVYKLVFLCDFDLNNSSSPRLEVMYAFNRNDLSCGMDHQAFNKKSLFQCVQTINKKFKILSYFIFNILLYFKINIYCGENKTLYFIGRQKHFNGKRKFPMCCHVASIPFKLKLSRRTVNSWIGSSMISQIIKVTFEERLQPTALIYIINESLNNWVISFFFFYTLVDSTM